MLFFLWLLLLIFNMLMYDLFQAVSIFLLNQDDFHSFVNAENAWSSKNPADLNVISQKKLSQLFLLGNSLTGLIYFGKVCICRSQPLHCRLLMVNACLVV